MNYYCEGCCGGERMKLGDSKIERSRIAPAAGTIKAVRFYAGDRIQAEGVLAILERAGQRRKRT
jgi:hypothetical protein